MSKKLPVDQKTKLNSSLHHQFVSKLGGPEMQKVFYVNRQRKTLPNFVRSSQTLNNFVQLSWKVSVRFSQIRNYLLLTWGFFRDRETKIWIKKQSKDIHHRKTIIRSKRPERLEKVCQLSAFNTLCLLYKKSASEIFEYRLLKTSICRESKPYLMVVY